MGDLFNTRRNSVSEFREELENRSMQCRRKVVIGQEVLVHQPDTLLNQHPVNIRKSTDFEICIEVLHGRDIETTVVERNPGPVVIAIHSGIG